MSPTTDCKGLPRRWMHERNRLPDQRGCVQVRAHGGSGAHLDPLSHYQRCSAFWWGDDGGQASEQQVAGWGAAQTTPRAVQPPCLIEQRLTLTGPVDSGKDIQRHPWGGRNTFGATPQVILVYVYWPRLPPSYVCACLVCACSALACAYLRVLHLSAQVFHTAERALEKDDSTGVLNPTIPRLAHYFSSEHFFFSFFMMVFFLVCFFFSVKNTSVFGTTNFMTLSESFWFFVIIPACM